MEQSPPEESVPSLDDQIEYCRFGKRDLAKTSWLAPLLNNRFGDALNLELRHEHLFFIRGQTILEDVGYSGEGTRFKEAEFGNSMATLADLRRNGYWLTGRIYHPQAMREALKRQQDGHYYSIFSNQCQDWADRLKRTASRVEREWGLHPGQVLQGLPPVERRRLSDVQQVPPNEPASIWMGLVAVVIGVTAIEAPKYFAGHFSLLLGGVFVASGISHALYAIRGRDMRAAVPILLTALIYVVGGTFMLLNTHAAVRVKSAIIAVTLGVEGAFQVFMALFSRPIRNWLATFAAGLAMLLCCAIVIYRWPLSGERLLGKLVGASLIAGGLSTIYLSQRQRNETD